MTAAHRPAAASAHGTVPAAGFGGLAPGRGGGSFGGGSSFGGPTDGGVIGVGVIGVGVIGGGSSEGGGSEGGSSVGQDPDSGAGVRNFSLSGRSEDGAWWVTAVDHGFGHTAAFAAWDPSVDWRDVTAADFDGDSLDDLAGRDPATGAWFVSLADGSGSTTLFAGRWSPATEWLDVAAADLAAAGDRGARGHFTNKADLVGRTAGGQWWAAVSNGDGTFRDVFLTAWDPAAGWRDVRLLDANADGATDLLGRTAGGDWRVALSRLGPGGEGLAYENVYLGGWNEAAGWRDVRVAGEVESVDGSRSGGQAIVGRASDGGLWMSWMTGFSNDQAATLGHSPIGSWVPDGGWRDVRAGAFARQTVELRTEVRGGTATQVIDIYAGRYGASASVSEGAASPWGRVIRIDYSAGDPPGRSGFVGSRVSFGTSAGPGTAFAVRFRGHWGADPFRNASSMPAEAYGMGGGDAFHAANGVADTLFGGDGLDVLVTGDPFDDFRQDG